MELLAIAGGVALVFGSALVAFLAMTEVLLSDANPSKRP